MATCGACPRLRLRAGPGLTSVAALLAWGLVQAAGCSPPVGPAGAKTERCASVHPDQLAHHDIGLGLAGSVAAMGRVPCLNVSARPAIVDRDTRLRQLQPILSSLPPDGSPECLVGDMYYAGGGMVLIYKTYMLYCPKKASGPVKAAIEYLGFRRMEEEQWRTMIPWIKNATNPRPVTKGYVFDTSEILVFSYYDGTAWHITPHFFLGNAGEVEPATRVDLDVFRLMHYIAEDLVMKGGFEKRYEERALWLPMLWLEVEETLNREGKWTIDMMDRKSRPGEN